jgi:hypothetical protein
MPGRKLPEPIQTAAVPAVSKYCLETPSGVTAATRTEDPSDHTVRAREISPCQSTAHGRETNIKLRHTPPFPPQAPTIETDFPFPVALRCSEKRMNRETSDRSESRSDASADPGRPFRHEAETQREIETIPHRNVLAF